MKQNKGSSNRCEKCIHSVKLNMFETGGRLVACVYILDTYHRRPCPSGNKCTEYEPKNR